MTYWLAALACAFDETSFFPLRMLALILVCWTALATFAVGVICRRPWVGAFAAVAFALTTIVWMEPAGGVGYNGELASMPFTMTGAALAGWGVRSQKLGWVVAAGACGALGALCKQLAGFLIVPLALWCWMGWADAPARVRWRAVGALLVGVLLPLAVVSVLYAVTGYFSELWYWGLQYNASVYMAPVTWSYREDFLLRWLYDKPLPIAIWAGATIWASSVATVHEYLPLRALRRW